MTSRLGQVRWRRLIIVGICLILVYVVIGALLPEIVITSIHVGKWTYQINWRL